MLNIFCDYFVLNNPYQLLYQRQIGLVGVTRLVHVFFSYLYLEKTWATENPHGQLCLFFCSFYFQEHLAWLVVRLVLDLLEWRWTLASPMISLFSLASFHIGFVRPRRLASGHCEFYSPLDLSFHSYLCRPVLPHGFHLSAIVRPRWAETLLCLEDTWTMWLPVAGRWITASQRLAPCLLCEAAENSHRSAYMAIRIPAMPPPPPLSPCTALPFVSAPSPLPPLSVSVWVGLSLSSLQVKSPSIYSA